MPEFYPATGIVTLFMLWLCWRGNVYIYYVIMYLYAEARGPSFRFNWLNNWGFAIALLPVTVVYWFVLCIPAMGAVIDACDSTFKWMGF